MERPGRVNEATGDRERLEGVERKSLGNNNRVAHKISIKCSHHDDNKVSPKELYGLPKCYLHVTYPKLKTEGRSD